MRKLPPFEDWIFEITEDLEFVSGELRDRMENNPEKIKESALTADAWSSRSRELLAEAEAQLDIAESENIMPKQSGMTDKDREVHLAASCISERMTRDKIQGYCDALAQRVSLAQSLLKYGLQFVHGNKEGRE